MPKQLSPEEGFLLSRIADGIRIADLLPLCPWDEKGTISYIQNLLNLGAIEFVNGSDQIELVDPKADDQTYIKVHLKHDEDDEELRELDLEFRKNILHKYHLPADTNPFDILETYPQAEFSEIKKQYVLLSRNYHPDRFFNKKLGHYKEKLDLIFSRIQKAYSALKDPLDRKAVFQKMRGRSAVEKKKGAKLRTSQIERKKRRISLDPKIEKIGKAETFYKKGLKFMDDGDYVSASNSFAFAMQTNPERTLYQKAYEDIKPKMQHQQAQRYLEKALSAGEIGITEESFAIAEQSLKYDSSIPKAQLLVAQGIIELDLNARFREARELLLRAKASMPEDPTPCVLLAKLYQAQGQKKEAKKEYAEALRRNRSFEV